MQESVPAEAGIPSLWRPCGAPVA